MKTIDEAVSAAPPTARALMAVGTVAAAAFSLGILVGSRGTQEELEAMQAGIDNLRSIIATNTADIATNRSESAELRSVIQRIDLERMGDRVARMDRELCLMRADAGGSITLQDQQECASR